MKEITEPTPCQFRFKGCTGQAIEYHELLGGQKDIKSSKLYNFQKATCRHCHSHWHLYMTKVDKNAIRATEQARVMDEQAWLMADWARHFSQNFI